MHKLYLLDALSILAMILSGYYGTYLVCLAIICFIISFVLKNKLINNQKIEIKNILLSNGVKEDLWKKEENIKNNYISEVFRSIPSKIIIINSEFAVIYHSESIKEIKRLIGINQDVFLGASLESFFNQIQFDVKNNSQEFFKTELNFLDKVFEVCISPVFNLDKKVIGNILEFFEVTNYKRFEEELTDFFNKVSVGNLGDRLSLDKKEGVCLNIAKTINNFMALLQDSSNCLVLWFQNIDIKQYDNQVPVGEFNIFKELNKACLNTQMVLANYDTELRAIINSLENIILEVTKKHTGINENDSPENILLEKVSSNINIMSANIKKDIENSSNANKIVSETVSYAELGGKVISSAVSEIYKIEESSKKISDIVTVMDELAFQTNLLALNAAVEAARAGDQGRGFSVVAHEVRNLAQRSAKYAKEIRELVRNSSDQVSSGVSLGNESGQVISKIVSYIYNVSELIKNSHMGYEEQALSADDVVLSIEQLSDIMARKKDSSIVFLEDLSKIKNCLIDLKNKNKTKAEVKKEIKEELMRIKSNPIFLLGLNDKKDVIVSEEMLDNKNKIEGLSKSNKEENKTNYKTPRKNVFTSKEKLLHLKEQDEKWEKF